MPTGSQPRVGYLTDHYPATSNTFVQREVLALRELGVDVHTFSTHRVGPEHVMSEDDREAFGTTFAVLPLSPLTLGARHLRALTTAPIAYLRTMVFALRLNRGPRRRLWQLFYFAEAVVLWLECRARGIEHLHAHFTQPAPDAALLVSHLDRRARGRRGLTWSFSGHGADIYDTDQEALGEKVRHAHAVVSVSEHGRDRLMALVEQEHKPKIRVVHCGIDLTRFPAFGDRRRPSDRLRVLNVGRLVEVKGHGLLIDALGRLVAGGVDAELTIVGDGPLRAELDARVRDRGLSDRVRFAGRIGQDDILSFYERADVFALTSLAEGIPVVLMEAMATELPVVAPAINGIPELVEDGEHGLLVAAGDVDRFAEALFALATDPARRAGIGRAARQRVATEFSLEGSARELVDLFGQCSNGGGAYVVPREDMDPVAPAATGAGAR